MVLKVILKKGRNKMAGKIIEKALRGATGKPARRIKQKPSEALRTDNVTETAEGSGTRAKLAKVGGATKGRASTLVNKLVAFDKIMDKKSEKAILLQNAINDLTKGKNALPPSVVKTARDKATEKMNKAKGAEMMRGGMANGKEHMYAAGGMVSDGLKALKASGPKGLEAFNKITGK